MGQGFLASGTQNFDVEYKKVQFGEIGAMERAVIKFSSEDCGICHKMAFYDQKVVEELGLMFVDCKMQDTTTYRKYRKILLTQYPDKAEMGWPTYIICDAPETDNFKILGEVKGGHPKGEFRSRLQGVLGEMN